MAAEFEPYTIEVTQSFEIAGASEASAARMRERIMGRSGKVEDDPTLRRVLGDPGIEALTTIFWRRFRQFIQFSPYRPESPETQPLQKEEITTHYRVESRTTT